MEHRDQTLGKIVTGVIPNTNGRAKMDLPDKLSSPFVVSAGAILSITGFAKIVTGFSSTRVLKLADPIFGVSFRSLMISAGAVEILVGLCCFLKNYRSRNLSLIAWLSTGIAIYRLGLLFVGWRWPCPCLGNLADALHIPANTADLIMILVLLYLLSGSYALLLFQAARKKRVDITDSGKRLE
jgi:hypothetical protein